ncbi:MAG: hypothetical protein OXC26_06145 [Albidovulum sp.]|nr:hypothetical protein [Albidovulum sp.]
MSNLQMPNGKSIESNELPLEVQEAIEALAKFVLSQHPSGPTNPEKFEGVELNALDVGTALSRHIMKTYLETRNRH